MELQREAQGFNFGNIQFCTSAFVSAARSVTFAMQASLKGNAAFDAWYQQKQEEMRRDELSKFFHDFRTVTQHIGVNVVGAGVGYRGVRKFYFVACDDLPRVPEQDVWRSQYFVDTLTGHAKPPGGLPNVQTVHPMGTRRIYEFIKANRRTYDVRAMCSALGVTRSGYYAWLKKPLSNRAEDDARLLRLIRASFKASHGIYGSPRVFLDLREAGETCSKHRVACLMRVNRIMTDVQQRLALRIRRLRNGELLLARLCDAETVRFDGSYKDFVNFFGRCRMRHHQRDFLGGNRVVEFGPLATRVQRKIGTYRRQRSSL